jgi:hypothetical protein
MAAIVPLALIFTWTVIGNAPEVKPSSELPLSSGERWLQLVGQIAGGPATAVAARDGHAFVAIGSQLVVFDTSDPRQLIEVARHGGLQPPVRQLILRGEFLYAAHSGGMQVFDVTDPTAPRGTGQLRMLEGAGSIAFRDDVAFVTESSQLASMLWVVDTSLPGQLKLLTQVATYRSGRVATTGNFAYLATGNELRVFGITDPLHPTALPLLEIGPITTCLVVSDRHLFIGTAAGIQVLDISNPAVPTLVGPIRSPSGVTGLALRGTELFVTVGTSGLHVLDVSDPANPIERLVTSSGGEAMDVAPDGQTAFVADGLGGLQAVAIAGPQRGQELGRVPSWDGAIDVAVSGRLAYVAAGSSGLAIFDLADLTGPELLGLASVPGTAQRVVVDGGNHHAYIGTQEGRLIVVDATKPAAPQIMGSLAVPGAAILDLALGVGGFVFVAANAAGLVAVDVRDPTRPRITGTLSGESYSAIDIEVRSGYAFTSGRTSQSGHGLSVVNVGDPSQPRLAAEVPVPSPRSTNDRGLALSGGAAYLVAGPALAVAGAGANSNGPPPPPPPEQRLAEVDVSHPEQPRLVRYLDLTASPRALAAADGKLFIASGLGQYYEWTEKLLCNDLTGAPDDHWSLAMPAPPLNVTSDGPNVLVAVGNAGVLIVRLASAGPTIPPPPTPTPDREPLAHRAYLPWACSSAGP